MVLNSSILYGSCVNYQNMIRNFNYERSFLIFRGLPVTNRNGLHVSAPRKLPRAAALALPSNVVDFHASETSRFSPLRARDISGPVILSHYENGINDFAKIDVTNEADAHVASYDCHGAVCLSSSMQSNVPSPFSGAHSHLGMPGSQWGQGYKYLSDHLHGSHYLTLRNEYRSMHSKVSVMAFTPKRSYSAEASAKEEARVISPKEKLKKAVADYGATVIVFHVTISLMSLGACYLLVSSGVDLAAVLQKLNMGDGLLSKAAAANAGTFVVAYAVHKVFAPVRIGITLTATPFIVRYLRNIGFLKKPSSAASKSN